jgi:glutamate N-acetyltransferase/amino-acid N-acetyltransferase
MNPAPAVQARNTNSATAKQPEGKGVSVNLPVIGDLYPVPGVQLASIGAAIKSPDRDDVALLVFTPGTRVAGVFTRSGFRAPPVDLAEQRIAAGNVRALLINSGNANAATGVDGREDALALTAIAADALDIAADSVAPFSTGVIGERLPVAKIAQVLGPCVDGLGSEAWEDVARAIMTTDTAPKALSRQFLLDDAHLTVTGIAKGSGMIRPDMATMLAFICCDAAISQDCLDLLVQMVADASFNRITVDGDTSTNDSFVIAATGMAENRLIEDSTSAEFAQLCEAITDLARSLAQSVVRDGEGASKFVTVEVSGGENQAECLAVAYTVAESPLVKTALFAGDPNWGRFCMAVGRAGVSRLDQAKVSVHVNDLCIVHQGQQHPDYREADGARVMTNDELTIRIELGRGSACERVWTSDLSYEYVRINAEYRS